MHAPGSVPAPRNSSTLASIVQYPPGPATPDESGHPNLHMTTYAILRNSCSSSQFHRIVTMRSELNRAIFVVSEAK